MDHAELVEALKDPAFYDPPVERVDFIQTHISSVFLTGERVYKLKKPVNFGFLDFSTLENVNVKVFALGGDHQLALFIQ